MTDMRTALQLETSQIKNTSSQNDVKKVSDFDEVRTERIQYSYYMFVLQLIQTIKNENARLSQEMRELSRLAKLEAALDADPTAVVSFEITYIVFFRVSTYRTRNIVSWLMHFFLNKCFPGLRW